MCSGNLGRRPDGLQADRQNGARLPVFRLALRNLLLGAVTMAAGVIIGLVVGI